MRIFTGCSIYLMSVIRMYLIYSQNDFLVPYIDVIVLRILLLWVLFHPNSLFHMVLNILRKMTLGCVSAGGSGFDPPRWFDEARPPPYWDTGPSCLRLNCNFYVGFGRVSSNVRLPCGKNSAIIYNYQKSEPGSTLHQSHASFKYRRTGLIAAFQKHPLHIDLRNGIWGTKINGEKRRAFKLWLNEYDKSSRNLVC